MRLATIINNAMNKLYTKYSAIGISIIFLLLSFGLMGSVLFNAHEVRAETAGSAHSNYLKDPLGNCKFVPGAPILGFAGAPCISEDGSATLLAQYMIALTNFFFRLAVVLAVVMIMIGGMQWMLAIGNSGKISSAKETIQQAVLGLILALIATLLFQEIDESFVKIPSLNLRRETIEVKCPHSLGPAVCRENGCYWQCGNPDDQGKDLNCAGSCVSTQELAEMCEDHQALALKHKNAKYPRADSSELTKLIACIKDNRTEEFNRLAREDIFTYEISNSYDHVCNYTRGNPICGKCAHALNSCHYGGESGINGAQAVDFNAQVDTRQNEQALYNEIVSILAEHCPGTYKTPRFEEQVIHSYYQGEIVSSRAAHHTHISTITCDRN